MSDFKKDDVVWGVQILGSENKYPENLNHLSFNEFWDDDYPWLSMVPLAWKLVNSQVGRVKAPTQPTHDQLIGWWSAPLHLCALGLGWNNIALGLRTWRENNFVEDHPILRFLGQTYGPSIQGLEHFLIRSGFNDEIIEAMEIHGFVGFSTNETPDLDVRSQGNTDVDRAFIESAKRAHSWGPRWSMVEPMLFGGSDSLHLSTHFIAAAEYDGTFYHDELELDEVTVLWKSEERIGVEAPAYKGFAYHLIAAAGEFMRDNEGIDPIVSLHIRNLGYIGDFQRSMNSGRSYIVSEPKLLNRAEMIHMWGN